ncbi:hypothetical protein DI494_22270, partial [Stenotrophomonas maltophilia]
MVTGEGRILHADRLLMLFAADVLTRNPGSMVIYDVTFTGQLSGPLPRHCGRPWRGQRRDLTPNEER